MQRSVHKRNVTDSKNLSRKIAIILVKFNNQSQLLPARDMHIEFVGLYKLNSAKSGEISLVLVMYGIWRTNDASFWPTVLSVEPMVQYVVFLSVVCLSSVVCDALYCGKTVRPSQKVSEGVNRKPGSKS